MRAFATGFLALAVPAALAAQVTVHPATIEPAAWQRFAVQVANPRPEPVVAVRVEVPDALGIIGLQAPPGWSVTQTAGSDTTPQVVTWTGDSLRTGRFEEFAFLARLRGDARRATLVFPVTLTRAGGDETRWGRGPDAAPPPRVLIRGSAWISSWGAAALAGVAFGVALLAVALASVRGRRAGG